MDKKDYKNNFEEEVLEEEKYKISDKEERIYNKCAVLYNKVPNTLNLKVVLLYVRCSTRIQVFDSYSLPTQEDRLKSYCEEQKLYYKGIYYDRGISGASDTDERKALRRILGSFKTTTVEGEEYSRFIEGDLKKGEGLIAVTIDRFYRDNNKLSNLYTQLKKDGKDLYVINMGGIINDKNQNWFAYGILSLVAESEREMIRHRVHAGIKFLQDNDKYITKPRFGWKSPGKKKQLVEDEDEQRVIDRIRALREENPKIKLVDISKILDKECPCEYFGLQKWHASTLRSIIDYEKNNIKDETLKRVMVKRNNEEINNE